MKTFFCIKSKVIFLEKIPGRNFPIKGKYVPYLKFDGIGIYSAFLYSPYYKEYYGGIYYDVFFYFSFPKDDYSKISCGIYFNLYEADVYIGEGQVVDVFPNSPHPIN